MPDLTVREPMVEFSLAAAELSIMETFTARRSRWDVEVEGSGILGIFGGRPRSMPVSNRVETIKE
jgi:hypothetical protein